MKAASENSHIINYLCEPDQFCGGMLHLKSEAWNLNFFSCLILKHKLEPGLGRALGPTAVGPEAGCH